MRTFRVSRVVLGACLSASVLSTAALLGAQQMPPIVQSAPQPVAQATPPPAPQPPRIPVPVKFDVVMTRFKGTEKIGSMPYSLLAVDGTRAMLRLGSSVPVPQMSLGEPGKVSPVTSYQYSDVGVSIDCNVFPQTDGRYRVVLLIEETSLAENVAGLGLKAPVIRRYRIDTQVIVRDGQATEFNVATDKVTGETIRGQITMTLLK